LALGEGKRNSHARALWLYKTLIHKALFCLAGWNVGSGLAVQGNRYRPARANSAGWPAHRSSEGTVFASR
jgi:hypothetical protein